MRLTTKLHFSVVRYTALAASVLLAACAGDSTAPGTAPAARSDQVTSPFVPTAASKSLVGISNGTYEFTIDPRRDQALVLGANYLYIPANAVCDISGSSYGVGHWDESCAAQRGKLTITATVRGASSAHPSIDFSPAMRFSPDTKVELYIYVPRAERRLTNSWVMNYCNDQQVCVDESLTDPSLATQTDRTNAIVFRRIKHFSGYIVTSLTDDTSSLLM